MDFMVMDYTDNKNTLINQSTYDYDKILKPICGFMDMPSNEDTILCYWK